VKAGVEDTTSEEAKKWNGFENYSFINTGEATKLSIEVDVAEDFTEYMNNAWPKALQKLKELAEN